jgi:hypothetical protein
MKHIRKFNEINEDRKSDNTKLREILSKPKSETDLLKLSLRQRTRILMSGLSTNYRKDGSYLQFTKSGQRSQVGHIEVAPYKSTQEEGYVFVSFIGLSKNGVRKETLDDAIGVILSHYKEIK